MAGVATERTGHWPTRRATRPTLALRLGAALLGAVALGGYLPLAHAQSKAETQPAAQPAAQPSAEAKEQPQAQPAAQPPAEATEPPQTKGKAQSKGEAAPQRKAKSKGKKAPPPVSAKPQAKPQANIPPQQSAAPPPPAPAKPQAGIAPQAVTAPVQPAAPRVAPPNLAELRRMLVLREAQAGAVPGEIAAAAQAYLVEYADGRYVDEALLALAQAQARLEQPERALQTYAQLIDDHRESPFREQAMTESLPLLQQQGDQPAAFARVDALVSGYPRSLQRTPALLWKAEAQYRQAEFAGSLETLKRVNTKDDLAGAQEARYYRVQTLALIGSGEGAWTPLQQYLKREDTPEHKAEVLMVVGGVAREAQRPEEALRFYRQVVEDYPVPAYLGEALYWRAALFAATRMEGAPPEVLGARRETAIGYYSAYLSAGHQGHLAAALAGRADLHAQAGRPAEALADYDAALQADPHLRRDPKVINARVALYQALGQPQQAVALLEAVRGDPKLTPEERTALQVQLAALHYEAKQCGPVEALLNPMPIIADPQLRPRAFFMRGFCRFQQSQWEKATFDLEGLINDPQYQDLALPPLLEAYEQSGQASRLVNLAEELLKAERVKPSEGLLTRLAGGYATLGEPALMLSAYQRLETVNPAAVQKTEIQLRMGEAHERMGRRDAALVHYRAVLDPPAGVPPPAPADYMTALERLQALYLSSGQLDELAALHAVAEKTVTTPADKARLVGLKSDLQVALASRALEQGRPQEALPALQAALKNTPISQPQRRARVLALLVTAQAKGGAFAKARETWDSERKAHADKAYRAMLATAMLELAQSQPELLSKGKGLKTLSAIHAQALADLPAEQATQRYQAAKALDAIYKAQGDHAARAALVTLLLKDGYDDATQRELHAYQGEVYRDWGQALLEQDDLEGAQLQLERSLEGTPAEDWRQRYDRVALLSRVYLKRQRFGQLVRLNETALPHIEDAALAGQVRGFLGQVYLQWGKAAEGQKNTKSARIRYAYALDYLPESDWQRRLAATAGLAKALQAEDKPTEAAAAYEAVLPQVTDDATRQQYALYLGRLYAEQVKNPAKAGEWLKQADRGDKSPLSLEAGYLWADQLLAMDQGDQALLRLRELATRDIAGTRWEVPIHYRIAVLQHQRKALEDALAHYRIVAAAKDPQARKLYRLSIEQSRAKAAEIESFLKAGGGRQDISVPKVRPD